MFFRSATHLPALDRSQGSEFLFSSRIARTLLLLLLVVAFESRLLAEPTAPDNRRPAVLTLHSYTSNDWCNGLQAGINEILVQQAGVDMYVDYMDSRKANTPEYHEVLRQLLLIKYGTIRFDLVIACDDHAYHYVNKYRDQLWPGVPVVFCGVNDFREQEFARLVNMTGISENNDLRPFVRSFQKLIPQLKTLHVICDNSSYTRETLPRLQEAMRSEAPAIQIQLLNNSLTAEELTTRLPLLPTDSAVFFLCFWQDKSGRYISTNEGQRIIVHSAVPVFTTQHNLIGQGAIADSSIDPFIHGAAAARIARDILSGKPASNIPASIGPPRRLAFDHAVLARFRISPSALPRDAQLVNEPFSFYRRYRTLVWIITGTIAILGILVMLLVIAVLQRRKAVERLTESEKKFFQAFNDSPVGQVISDLDTNRYLEVNQRCISTLGYSREEVVLRTPENIGWMSATDLAAIDKSLQGTGGPRELEIRFRHKDGHPVICSYTAQRVRINGRDCLLSTIVDITLHKRADEEREKLQAQLNQSQKMESIGRLAGGVAHDFNNMLTAIQINASLAREEAQSGSPLRESLDEILLCTSRSADLTQRLLAFARKQTIAPQVLDLNTTVDGMLKMLQRLIGESIKLGWQPSSELWPVKLDPGQIDQILANLCVNARDAINGIGNVTILTRNTSFDATFCANHAGYSPGDYVLLVVSDDGCGMDDEVLGHIFEPFFTTKSAGLGTGLGLATVYGIVKQNGGFINVYSEPGHGSAFNIYLPRHLNPATGTRPPLPASSAGRGHESILLVEDEPSILRISKRTLESLGYTVTAAASPGEAIRIASEYDGKFDLLLTDVIMPEMTGRDLAQKLLARYPALKCLYMSGYTADVIARQGVLEQDIHFVQKPFTIQDLASKVRRAIDATT